MASNNFDLDGMTGDMIQGLSVSNKRRKANGNVTNQAQPIEQGGANLNPQQQAQLAMNLMQGPQLQPDLSFDFNQMQSQQQTQPQLQQAMPAQMLDQPLYQSPYSDPNIMTNNYNDTAMFIFSGAQESNMRHPVEGIALPFRGQVNEGANPHHQIPGWQPAQHQHQPSLGALEQHASQYAAQAKPPVLAPPHPHRGSGDEIPSPTTASCNKRVPIERQKRGSHQSIGSSPKEPPSPAAEQAMVVRQSGPMSSSVSIPQRPRPGRKPIPHEDAADRRRVQNRMAQRNFRDKRQAKLQEALEELAAKKEEYQAHIAEMNRQLEDNRATFRQLEQRLNAQIQSAEQRAINAEQRATAAERRNQELERALKSQQQLPSIANFRPVHSTTHSQLKDEPTPPGSENDMDMEVDFTNFGRTNQSGYGLRPATTNDSNQMDYSLRAEDHCGFCTDEQNCACAQEKRAEAEKPAPVSVPGSCEQCRADPVRAQACRDMAASAQISAQRSTSDAARQLGVTTNSSMPPPPRTTCSSMVDSFNKYGQRTSSIGELFGGRLNTYPAQTGGGYEFEETEAAEVLSNLSRRSTIAESPKNTAGSPN